MGTEHMTDISGNSSDTYDGFMSRIGITLAKRLPKGNVVYFETNHYLDTFDAHSYYEVKVGFVFSQK